MGRESGVTGSDLRSKVGGWPWLVLAVVLVALDQWTKQIAVGALSYGQPIPVLPGLNWTLVHNYGSAFGFLNDGAGWQRWFFLVLSGLIMLALLEWLRRTPKSRWDLCLPLALLIGGGIGNLIDRAYLGYVIDFIDVYYDRWHWPAFNLADSGITVGIVMLLWHEFFGQRETAVGKSGTRDPGPGTR
jgi:signal peptidase II